MTLADLLFEVLDARAAIMPKPSPSQLLEALLDHSERIRETGERSILIVLPTEFWDAAPPACVCDKRPGKCRS